jgi:hypothetical protein
MKYFDYNEIPLAKIEELLHTNLKKLLDYPCFYKVIHAIHNKSEKEIRILSRIGPRESIQTINTLFNGELDDLIDLLGENHISCGFLYQENAEQITEQIRLSTKEKFDKFIETQDKKSLSI